MKELNLKIIRDYSPCYDPIKYLPEEWKGNVIDLLEVKDVPFEDVLWVIMRTDLVSEKLIRLFAVWCARQVQHLMKDERSLKALDVAEAFANGAATQDELAAARDAARDAAWAVAMDAAWAVAMDAARDAAWAVAWAVAMDAQKKKLKEMLIAGIETGDVK
jgi:hypothetical protein